MPNGHDISFATRYEFLCGDFESAWRSMAQRAKTGVPMSGGNYIFAQMTMVLLEMIGYAAQANATAFREFRRELKAIEPRYFKRLPGSTGRNHNPKIPWWGSYKDRQAIQVLFDTIRNGQAHVYQQILMELDDGSTFGAAISGVNEFSPESPGNRDPEAIVHLDLEVQPNAVWLKFQPDVMLAHIRSAVDSSGFLGRNLISDDAFSRQNHTFTRGPLVSAHATWNT